jgi:hypothetical protein
MDETEDKPKMFKRIENESKLTKLTTILCSTFSKKLETSSQKTRELKLFKDLLVISHIGSPALKELPLTFDISFEVIREPQ